MQTLYIDGKITKRGFIMGTGKISLQFPYCDGEQRKHLSIRVNDSESVGVVYANKEEVEEFRDMLSDFLMVMKE